MAEARTAEPAAARLRGWEIDGARVRATQFFAINFCRLPRVDESPGLVTATIGAADGNGQMRKIGALTDVALRARLGHFGNHSANELALLRQALGADRGRATVQEGWTGLGSCLQFWHDFSGSQVRPVEWMCEACAAPNRIDVGASVGETFSRACRCGAVKRITTASHLPALK